MSSVLLPTIKKAFCGVTSADLVSPNTTSPEMIQPLMPADFSSVWTFLLSFSALHDWLKLIVIGGILETCRRAFYWGYNIFINSFFISATFQDGDDSYDWIMVWLTKQPSWSQARELQISTKSFGLDNPAILVPGEEDDASSLVKGSRKLAYMPSVSTTHSIWYKRRWITINRSKEPSGYYGQHEELLTIRIMTRHQSFLNDLLLEAKQEYMTAQGHKISIYVSNSSSEWRHVASRPKRPLHSIVLDPGIKDLLIDDARDFLASKSWYATRGIPFRRGYLLYGAPGSGKTSIIHSLAGELGLDVYIISLSRIGMDDTVLNELICELPEKCIALMEDIDAAFTQTLNRDEHASEEESEEPPESPKFHESPQFSSRLSLSGLLNALDGVGAQEGRILFATTNKYESLDPALCRPGRMDIHIEFKLASKFQARELFRCFYLPVDEGVGGEDDDIPVKESVESGSGSSESKTLIDFDIPSEPPKVSPPSTPHRAVSERIAAHSVSHAERAPNLSRPKILHLATRFADAIPDRRMSMASLQGYLMGYKTRPFDAVKDITAWMEKECSP
ncbi:hypothetical protein D9615_007405 [Tricholomella constricta]|uniref:P-loop containing nucleoside triphosphate hydrolase protein n=1 Tax=Tricholomella constricta TaxID=117010 RepID=A0A8H5GXV8_9AGAR|nr:hypothetical protein D9615_007405 [Tricholomella constricta]